MGCGSSKSAVDMPDAKAGVAGVPATKPPPAAAPEVAVVGDGSVSPLQEGAAEANGGWDSTASTGTTELCERTPSYSRRPPAELAADLDVGGARPRVRRQKSRRGSMGSSEDKQQITSSFRRSLGSPEEQEQMMAAGEEHGGGATGEEAAAAAADSAASELVDMVEQDLAPEGSAEASPFDTPPQVSATRMARKKSRRGSMGSHEDRAMMTDSFKKQGPVEVAPPADGEAPGAAEEGEGEPAVAQEEPAAEPEEPAVELEEEQPVIAI
mmetsp:Transcript_12786/g.44429  ORF Transcript_12786/g.44429 Transcript_12786/m.44429 type:complete len:268 (+) Transcript_12786:83-886(+)